jgi:uncharacterized protein with PQ loop repeat
MDVTDIIGFCAMCLSAVKNVPQFKQINDTDDVSSFSKQALLIGIVATFFWIYYGISKKSKPMIFGYTFALLYEFYILHKILKSEKDNK